MKKYLLLAGLVISRTWAVTISGEISGNETWSGSVLVTGDVTVTAGTLFIEPGTDVEFAHKEPDSAISINVLNHGYILAQGEPGNRIRFTSALSLPTPGSWDGIKIKSRGSAFRHCDFSYGTTFIDNEAPSGDTLAKVYIDISNCRFTLGTMALSSRAKSIIQVDSCRITACNRGVYTHNIMVLNMSYTYLLDLDNAMTLNCIPGIASEIALNHVTINRIGLRPTEHPEWWHGYGIYTDDEHGILLIFNSYLGYAVQNIIKGYAWLIAGDYNFYCKADISLCVDDICWEPIGPDDVTVDKICDCMDFRNYPAEDGLWRGAEQEGDFWFEWGATRIDDYRPERIDFTLPGNSHSGLYDLNGRKVLRPEGRGIYLEVDERGAVRKRVW